MRKGDRIMKDYTDRSRLHLDTVDKLDYRALLAGQLGSQCRPYLRVS